MNRSFDSFLYKTPKPQDCSTLSLFEFFISEMLQQAIQQSQSQSQAQAQAHSQAHIQANPQAHSRETTPSSAVTSPRPAIAATSTSSQTSLQTLATRYNTQLQQLREIGFFDQESSLRALEATNGDVQLAVNLLFHDS